MSLAACIGAIASSGDNAGQEITDIGGALSTTSPGGFQVLAFNPPDLASLIYWANAKDAATVTLITAGITAGNDFADAVWTKTAVNPLAGNILEITGAAPLVAQNVASAEVGTSARLGINYDFTAENISGVRYVVLESVAGQAVNQIWFDLQTGILGTVGAQMIEATMINVAPNRYACHVRMRFTGTGTTASFRLRFSTADGSFADPVAGSQIYVAECSAPQRLTSGVVNKQTAVDSTNVVAGSRLGYRLDFFNGFPCFEGAGQQWLIVNEASVVAAFAAGLPLAIYYSFIASTDDNTFAVIGVGGTVNSSRTRIFGQNSTGSPGKWGAASINDAVVAFNAISTGSADVLPHVHNWYTDATGTFLFLSLDNNAADPNPGAANQNILLISLTKFALMCRPDLSPDQAEIGFLGEVFIYAAAHGSSERTRANTYLNQEWMAPTPPLPVPPIDPTKLRVAKIRGQSNASGNSLVAPAILPGQLMRSIVIGANNAVGVVALGTYDYAPGGTQFNGIELPLGNGVTSVGQQGATCKTTKGGSQLAANWGPGMPEYLIARTAWLQFVIDMAATYPGRTIDPHMHWLQGESESAMAQTDPRVVNYQADLAAMFNAIRSPVGSGGCGIPDMWAYLYEVHPQGGTGYPSLPLINAAIRAYCLSDPQSTFIPTADVPTSGIHYAAPGINILGNRGAFAQLTVIQSRG